MSLFSTTNAYSQVLHTYVEILGYASAMTLTAHAIVGAALVSIVPEHPVAGVCAAFASHFLVDAIPHVDYRIRSASINTKIRAPLTFDRNFFLDMLSIGADAVLGMLLALILFSATPWQIALGAFAGMFPDALQFAYARFPREPLSSLQRFHEWIHTRHRLREHKIAGVVSQVLFLVAVVLFTTFIWSGWHGIVYAVYF